MKALLLLVLVLVLSGCASLQGVQATADERAACAAETCTVWTPGELRKLIETAMQQGYRAGIKGSRNSI